MGNLPPSFPDLAERWLSFALSSGQDAPGNAENRVASFDLDWLVNDDPERAWIVVKQILEKINWVDIAALLAAGPLEDLLSRHGDAFIERAETEAISNPRFAFLLGGIWQFQISDENWRRIGRVANRAAWDDPHAEEALGFMRRR